MMEHYYTVEQASQLLNIHEKTIQRYIREGKLRASKIGKSYRISGHDLSVFVERAKAAPAGPEEAPSPPRERIKASAVIDVGVHDSEEAMRIVNGLSAALNAKPPEYGRSTMHAQYLEQEGMVRVSLWGGAHFLAAMMGFVAALAERAEEE